METAESQVLRGKTALITGGTSGIGLATAALFAAQGASVLVCGRSEPGLAQAEAIEGVSAFRCDVAEADDRARLFREVKSRWGRLDTVFTAAGVAHFRALEDETPETWRGSFATNVEGTLFVVQGALPFLVSGSTVVLCGSVADQVGCPYMSAYAASKGAVRTLAQALAVELSSRGIRVNCLAPGPTETPIHGKYGLSERRLNRVGSLTQARLHLGRMAQAEEIARGALFLASEASSFMIGQELVLDGGLSL